MVEFDHFKNKRSIMKDSKLKFWIGKEDDPDLHIEMKAYVFVGIIIGISLVRLLPPLIRIIIRS